MPPAPSVIDNVALIRDLDLSRGASTSKHYARELPKVCRDGSPADAAQALPAALAGARLRRLGRGRQGRRDPARHRRARRAPVRSHPDRRADRGGARAALPVALLASRPAARRHHDLRSLVVRPRAGRARRRLLQRSGLDARVRRDQRASRSSSSRRRRRSSCKFWLQISKDEQLRRFKARAKTAFKRFKITARGLAQPREVERLRAAPSATWSTAPAPRSRRGRWSRPRTNATPASRWSRPSACARAGARLGRRTMPDGTAELAAIPFRGPAWLPGGHAQTIYPHVLARPEACTGGRAFDTPDGDFVDVDWLGTRGHASGCAARRALPWPRRQRAFALRAALMAASPPRLARRGPAFSRLRRQLNGLPARITRAITRKSAGCCRHRASDRPGRPMFAVGISLGGSALINWIGRAGSARSDAEAAAAVSMPLDLIAAGISIGEGLNRMYTCAFPVGRWCPRRW